MKERLKNLSKIKIGYPIARGELTSENLNDSIIVINASNINKYSLNIDNSLCIKKNNKIIKYLLKKGDVLISTRFKRVATVFNENIKAIPTSSLIVIEVTNKDKIIPEYLVIYLNSAIGQKNITKLSEGSNITSISLNSLRNLEIMMPVIKTQKEIIKIHKLILKEKEISNLLQDKKDKLYQTIINKKILEKND